jgi:hypothetical protein
MVNIGQSFGGMPVYFIRFNPDEYKPHNKKAECEKIGNRYKLVESVIDSILKHRVLVPTALVSALYLYYDGWNKYTDENWKIITGLDEDD